MRIAIAGATGKMGRTLVRLSGSVYGFEVVGGACAAGDENVGKDLGELSGIGTLGVVATADVDAALLGADVVIDFSSADAFPRLLAAVDRRALRLVSGTTGLDASAHAGLDALSKKSAVLWAANMSLGVQVLSELVTQALERLGSAFDVELVEVHHKKKVDAPSGTALGLVEAARAARPELKARSSREGMTGPRRPEELGVLAVRGGDVIGDHTIHLFGPGERLELTHRATDRDLFAHGALRAAAFLRDQPPGRYTIADVLGGTPNRRP